jgi:Fur family ferric uptake transcriptional regulator
MERLSTYKTKQRQAILNYLIENKNKHVTIEDIVMYLKNSNQLTGQTTVYRYINLLITQGKVKRYIIDGKEAACFQYVGNKRRCLQHCHLKCEHCGEIFHVDCKILKDFEKYLKFRHKFNINTSKTVIYGTCEKCRGGRHH